jgi:hypothetical protein
MGQCTPSLYLSNACAIFLNFKLRSSQHAGSLPCAKLDNGLMWVPKLPETLK